MQSIKIIGARMHNLKNINVEIPRDKLVVITGVSGSGKSSLAFDTIYAEGQRRYVESLSAYARQFLQLTGKPEVENIDGLSPAIAIDQKSISKNPRSTVGTITEIYDYLRLIYAKIGHPHCPKCGKIIKRHNITSIVDEISSMPEGTKLMILAPIIKGEKGTHIKTFERIEKEGFVRFRVDGEIKTITDKVELNENLEHSIEIVVDRIVVKDLGEKFTETSKGERFSEINPNRTRIADSLEIAIKHGDGFVYILNSDTQELKKYSNKFHCEVHNEISLPEIEPKFFSFNSPHGACEKCHGLGQIMQVDEDLVVPNKNLTIAEGALHPWASYDIDKNMNYKLLSQVAKKYKFDFKTPYCEIPEKIRDVIMNGAGEEKFSIDLESEGFAGKMSLKYNGVATYVQKKYEDGSTEFSKANVERYMLSSTCTKCNGKRLREEVLGITIDDKNIIDVTQMSIDEIKEFFENIEKNMTSTEKKIADKIVSEIKNRLKFLKDVGLAYLTLNRGADTLSGGEGQRIRLATQIGSALQGVLYVLDEPSIGLHQKDNDMLIRTMRYLRDLGNTVLVVEHDEDTMRAADYIIEIGPKAGKHGGELTAFGTYDEIIKNDNSITGKYLSGKLRIEIPKTRRKGNGKTLEIIGARGNNLRNVHAKIPLGCFVGVSGVSGSGKSSLINQTLVPELNRMLNKAKSFGLEHDEIKGVNNLDKIISIDQSPIGKTPKSNPATYTGVFTLIRDLFANQPESKLRGYKSGRFSFNVKGGRCEECSGDGVKKIEMYFLPDVYVTCETCNGKRYNRETLEVTFRGKNIAEVLDMTVSEALEFFGSVPKIKSNLQTLEDVGLGYIHLGQPSTQLSGGEAQRVKLSSELSRTATGKTIYVLDEPTTGLHFDDINKLLSVLQSLVDKGNSILIIEHNIDVLKTCDYIIDIGPDGGNGGGEIVAEGTPEKVAENKKSYTAKWLKKIL